MLGFTDVSTVSVGAQVGPLVEVDSEGFRLESVFLQRDGARLERMG